MAKKNEVAKTDGNFVALSGDSGVGDLIRENLGGDTVGVFDLQTIKVPPAAGTHWMIPSAEGVNPQVSLEGIVLHQSNFRAYWESDFGESEQNDPDCSAKDAKRGFGKPGGDCLKCPLAQFGSKGKGQACTMKKRVIILRESSILPSMIELPPSSLRDHKKFMLSLSDIQLPVTRAVVKLTLIQKPRPVPHSVVSWEVVRRLSEDEIVEVSNYADKFMGSLNLGGSTGEGSGA